jgi:signal transduction histidine kinase
VPDLDAQQLARELALRKRLLEALLVFSRGVSARSSLPAALESLCAETASLLGTRRVSVWLHDRKARTLTLAASSDRRDSDAPQSVGADDESPVAAALRRDVPEVSGSGARQCLAAPLRGWRRALGSLVMEGEPKDLTLAQYVDIVRDFAPQLSVAIENLLSLDEVIRQHAQQAHMEARLEPAEKLAAVGQFMAGIAHELNNPLQGVLGHVELLVATAPHGSTLRADLRRVYADADRAAKVVRNLLVFAGSRRASRRRLDFGRLVNRTVSIREATPNRPQITIEQHGTSTLPAVVGDTGLLQQALMNVLLNAEQAVAEVGDTGLVRLTGSVENKMIRLTIEDSGPGIDPQSIDRIFEPFFTTKDTGKGTGLGLAITAGIVQEHGGRITASASPLGGAMFVVELPAAD